MKLYLAVFKRCRRSRNANPIQAIIEIIKTIYIITATTFLVKSDGLKFLWNLRVKQTINILKTSQHIA